MKKLALHLDELMVESFETSDPQQPRGTVKGNDWSQITECVTDEYYSCPDSCGVDTCNPTNCGTTGTGTGTGQTQCNCPSAAGTCEPTAPDPVGTCCYYMC